MRTTKRFVSFLLVVVMLCGVMPYVETGASTGLTLVQLREKFPHGKYWNHAGNPGPSNNNQDGWTNTPCTAHNGIISGADRDVRTCNGFAPNGTQLAWQCMGYAEKLGYDATGYNPRSNANGWQTYTSASALDNLKPGDIVRYKNDGHSIYVTGVNGDIVTYTDCNSDGHCIIRWDVTISKSTLRSSFTHVRSAPTAVSPGASTPPTVASLSIDKFEMKIGEQFKMTLYSDTAHGFYLAIYDADSGEKVLGENVASEYYCSFQRAGHYKAYMTAYNDQGGVDSNWVDFYVYGSAPTKATMVADKEELALGETVTLMTSTDAYYANIYTSIYLYNETNNGTLVYGGKIPYTFSYTPSQAGVYTMHASAYTNEGGADTNRVTFYVGKYNVRFDANGGNDAPSAQTKVYGKELILSSTVPDLAGYTFLGWSADKDATKPDYHPGASFAQNYDVTLYAVWEKSCAESHTYSTRSSIESTCTSAGRIVYTCTVCGDSYEETLPATGHDYQNNVCVDCGDVLIAEYGVELHLSDAKASAGGKVTVDIVLDKNVGFAYLNLMLDYDTDVLELVSVSNGTVADSLTQGKSYIWAQAENATSTGVLATLTFAVKKDATAGTYAVSVSCLECCNENEQDVAVLNQNGTVTVTDFVCGDATGDGKVDGKDATRLLRYLANYDPATGTSETELSLGGDCNGDGVVNGRDVTRLLRYLANYDPLTGESSVELG